MSEVAPAGGGTGPNRMFIIIVLGLAALLIIGLLAVGGIFLAQQLTKPSVPPTAAVKISTATQTRVIALAATTTLEPATPTVAATSTPVLSLGTPIPSGLTPTVAVSDTVVPGPGTPGAGTPGSGTLPKSGLGEDLLLLAGGVVLVLIIFAARRARATAN